MGASPNVSTINTSSPEASVWTGVSGSGNLLKASAFTCCVLVWHTIVYSYNTRVSAQRWILPDAWGEIALLSLKSVSKDLWLVCSLKWCLKTYEWKRVTPHTHTLAPLSQFENTSFHHLSAYGIQIPRVSQTHLAFVWQHCPNTVWWCITG